MAIILYFTLSKPGGFQLSEAKAEKPPIVTYKPAIVTCQGFSLRSSSQQNYTGAWAKESQKVSLGPSRVCKNVSRGKTEQPFPTQSKWYKGLEKDHHKVVGL